MVYEIIAIIVIVLQIIGFNLARRNARHIPQNLNFMVNYNMRICIASLYIIAMIWIGSTIASLVAPTHPVLYYLIFASILLTGIGIPLRYYRLKKQKSKGQD